VGDRRSPLGQNPRITIAITTTSFAFLLVQVDKRPTGAAPLLFQHNRTFLARKPGTKWSTLRDAA
jgi:hypothetical protein